MTREQNAGHMGDAVIGVSRTLLLFHMELHLRSVDDRRADSRRGCGEGLRVPLSCYMSLLFFHFVVYSYAYSIPNRARARVPLAAMGRGP